AVKMFALSAAISVRDLRRAAVLFAPRKSLTCVDLWRRYDGRLAALHPACPNALDPGEGQVAHLHFGTRLRNGPGAERRRLGRKLFSVGGACPRARLGMSPDELAQVIPFDFIAQESPGAFP